MNLFPQPAFAQLDCLNDPFSNACYDPDLEIAVGDILTWVVEEHIINNTRVYYGVDSDEPLKIHFEVLQDFRGKNASEVLNKWSDYFYTNRTVAGELVEEKTLYDGINRWIEPTLKVLNDTDKTIVNWFENVYEEYYSDPYEYIDGQRLDFIYDITIYNELQNGIWLESFEETRKNIDDPSIQSRSFHETKLNIYTGITEEITDIYEYNNWPERTNWTSVIRFDSGKIPNSISKITANLPLLAGLIIGLLVIFAIFIIIYRKLK